MPYDAYDQQRPAADNGWTAAQPQGEAYYGPSPAPVPVPVPYAAVPPGEAQHGYPYPPAPVVVVPLKTPGIAVLLSFLWLGAGHLYAGKIAAGVVLMVVDFFVVLIAFIPFVGWILAPLLWVPLFIVAAITSTVAASNHNARLTRGPYR